MLSSTDTAPGTRVRHRHAAAPEDTDATVLLVLSRDTGLVRALLEGTFPASIRLHLVRTPSAALGYLDLHSPDAFVLDAGTGLPEEARTWTELAFLLRRRNVPLVMVTPAGRAARSFLEVCASRAIDIRWSRDRDARTLGPLVQSGIDRRRRRLRLASVLTPLVRSVPAEAVPGRS
ncbi:MAG: hypothetical protein P8Y02_12945 [Deinococcales bacterium]